jgi:hypothetical protein
MARSAIVGLIGTTSVVIGALVGGANFETHLPGAWFFGMPGGPLGSIGTYSNKPPIASMLAIYGGLILLCRVWWNLARQLRAHPGFPVKRVVAVVAIWAIPLLIAPPLFSRDVYSYAGQGELASLHINPYAYGTGVLGVTPFSTLPDSVWADTASPYGPTFLGIDKALDDLSGHHILPDLVLLRLLEVAGLAMVVAATPTLARALRRDPAEAVLLGAGSPLVLITLVGGAHNDALMLGFLLAGLAVARRFGTIPGIVLCALAAGVKSPAILGVLFLGWVWAGTGASFWRRVAHTALAGLISLITLECITALSGLSWGWLHTATSADASFTGVTPVSSVARVVSDLAEVVDVHLSVLTLHGIFSVFGLAVAGLIGIRLLLGSPQRGVERCLGMTLLVLALLGPVVWAWYVTWGVVVLAPALVGRLRTVVMFLITYWTVLGATKIRTLFVTLAHTSMLLDLMLIAALAALAIVPLGLFHQRRHRPAAPLPPGLSSVPTTLVGGTPEMAL